MYRLLFISLVGLGCASDKTETDSGLDSIDDTAESEEVDNGPTAEDLTEGNLVITEIQKNPCVLGEPENEDSQAPCLVDDNMGEWFEMYNNTSNDINLKNLIITDNNDTPERVVVDVDVIVAAGDFVVFGVNGDTATNGGVDVDWVYDGQQLQMSNSDDEIILSNGSLIIDMVGYDNGTDFPDDKGFSLSLNPDAMDATSNDSGTNWCNASSVYGDGDSGTPGAANDACTD